jgi:hypothetical protein
VRPRFRRRPCPGAPPVGAGAPARTRCRTRRSRTASPDRTHGVAPAVPNRATAPAAEPSHGPVHRSPVDRSAPDRVPARRVNGWTDRRHHHRSARRRRRHRSPDVVARRPAAVPVRRPVADRGLAGRSTGRPAARGARGRLARPGTHHAAQVHRGDHGPAVAHRGRSSAAAVRHRCPVRHHQCRSGWPAGRDREGSATAASVRRGRSPRFDPRFTSCRRRALSPAVDRVTGRRRGPAPPGYGLPARSGSLVPGTGSAGSSLTRALMGGLYCSPRPDRDDHRSIGSPRYATPTTAAISAPPVPSRPPCFHIRARLPRPRGPVTDHSGRG